MSEQPSWWRTRAAAIVAAAAVVLVAGGVVLATTRGGDSPAPGPGGEPISPGSASCVELYSVQSLKNRAIAFDGTVESVDGDVVTFAVGEWFKGGSASEVTLKGASMLSGVTSAGPSVSLEAGSRLLVAGDGGFAWACGFTQSYDASVASEWRSALR